MDKTPLFYLAWIILISIIVISYILGGTGFKSASVLLLSNIATVLINICYRLDVKW